MELRKRNYKGELKVYEKYKVTNINDLPAEILFKIFEYVNFKDIQYLGKTCRRLNQITANSQFLSKTILKFKNHLLVDDESPISTFLESSRVYKHLHIQCCRIGTLNNFLDKFGGNIITLVLEDLSLCENGLIYILKKLPNLKTLEINYCYFHFTTQTTDLPNYIPNLQKLFILRSGHIETIISVIFPLLTNLKEFTINGCQIDNIRKYYFSSDKRKNTLKVVALVNRLTSTLTELMIDLDCYGYEQIRYENLLELKKLNLKKFVSCPCYNIDLGNFLFILTQRNLKSLDLSYLYQMKDLMINTICDILCSLESLNLFGVKGITNASIVNLSKLKNLKELDITGCLSISAIGLLQGIASRKNKKLRSLKMRRIDATVKNIVKIVQNLPNLRELDVAYCNGLKNTSVQAIFKHCKLLTHLNISGSDWVNDSGITGVVKKEFRFRPSINDLKGLRWLDISDCKRIGNHSWEYFKLPNLTFLNISHPIYFSVKSVETLLTNCPSIERLIVRGITNRHANAIFEFSKRLCYLAAFEFEKWSGRSITTRFCSYNCCVEKRVKRHRTKTSFYGFN